MHEPVEQVFKHVRVGVMTATAGRQVPWESSSLTGDFYFSAPSQAAPETDTLAAVHMHGDVISPAPSKTESGGFGNWVSSLFASTPTAAALSSGGKPAPQAAGPLMAGAHAVPLLLSLGIRSGEFDAAHDYPQSAVRRLIDTSPRQVELGSTPEQIRAAYALCRQYSSACRLS